MLCYLFSVFSVLVDCFWVFVLVVCVLKWKSLFIQQKKKKKVSDRRLYFVATTWASNRQFQRDKLDWCQEFWHDIQRFSNWQHQWLARNLKHGSTCSWEFCKNHHVLNLDRCVRSGLVFWQQLSIFSSNIEHQDWHLYWNIFIIPISTL
jgi:hypothetical protein